MLLGSLPLGRHVQLDRQRAWFDADTLDEWAGGLKAHPVPVLLGHDPDRVVGWCDKAVLSQDRAMLFGQLVAEYPDARTVARMIRSRHRDGLSPGVKVRRGVERYYRAVGRWGEGTVLDLPELSVVFQPQVQGARWLGA